LQKALKEEKKLEHERMEVTAKSNAMKQALANDSK
jgi:hypothetical protein